MSQPAGQRAGKIMLGMLWIVGLFLATRFFADWEARRLNSNPDPQSAYQGRFLEVLLKANAQGHFVASGQINQQSVVFLLDTGATDVAIPAQLAASLGLVQGEPQRLSTAGGQRTGYRTQIAQLRLGKILLKDVRALLVPDLEAPLILLGMSALKQLEFIQRDGTLVLRQPVSENHE